MQSHKQQKYLCLFPIQNIWIGNHSISNGFKPFNITVIQGYSLTSNAEEAEVDSSMKTYKTF